MPPRLGGDMAPLAFRFFLRPSFSPLGAHDTLEHRGRYLPDMDLTPAEVPVVERAVAAYRKAKAKHVGQFPGITADRILEELAPSPLRWNQLASFVIATVEDPTRRKP